MNAKTVVGVSSTMGSHPILSATLRERIGEARYRLRPVLPAWPVRWRGADGQWRGAGVAERARLEIVWAAMSRGFESRSLRHPTVKIAQETLLLDLLTAASVAPQADSQRRT